MRETQRRAAEKRAAAGWVVMLLPPFVVLLFYSLRRVLPVPSAAGISFLMTLLAAYWLAPRTRIRVFNLIVGMLLAVLLAIALSMVWADRW